MSTWVYMVYWHRTKLECIRIHNSVLNLYSLSIPLSNVERGWDYHHTQYVLLSSKRKKSQENILKCKCSKMLPTFKCRVTFHFHSNQKLLNPKWQLFNSFLSCWAGSLMQRLSTFWASRSRLQMCVLWAPQMHCNQAKTAAYCTDYKRMFLSSLISVGGVGELEGIWKDICGDPDLMPLTLWLSNIPPCWVSHKSSHCR